jgi:hypothetical protein
MEFTLDDRIATYFLVPACAGSEMIAFKPLTRLPAVLASVSAARLMAQSVFPTGTTIFDPDRTWSGFTVCRRWRRRPFPSST